MCTQIDVNMVLFGHQQMYKELDFNRSYTLTSDSAHIDVNNGLLRDKKRSTQIYLHTELIGHKQTTYGYSGANNNNNKDF